MSLLGKNKNLQLNMKQVCFMANILPRQRGLEDYDSHEEAIQAALRSICPRSAEELETSAIILTRTQAGEQR